MHGCVFVAEAEIDVCVVSLVALVVVVDPSKMERVAVVLVPEDTLSAASLGVVEMPREADRVCVDEYDKYVRLPVGRPAMSAMSFEPLIVDKESVMVRTPGSVTVD